MTNDPIRVAISTLQEWAKGKYGEQEYAYYRVNHFWRESRTASGRSRNDGCYAAICRPWQEQPRITKEEYDANVRAGNDEATRAFLGKRRGGNFYTYERRQVKDGWQDELQKLVVKEAEHDD